MSNGLYNNMLSAYDLSTEQSRRNAVFEVNQQIILAGLYNGGFFDVAAFYGGTCLRIFHGLQRFSEDMDFSLLTQDDKFDFTKYFPAIVDAFTMVGREVEIKKKDKKTSAHPGLGEGGKFHLKGDGTPLPDGTVMKFALVGNQNSGKTTLFNRLTGSKQHVGNFP